MRETGRALRLSRLRTDGRYLIVAMDHGITVGPVAGLEDMTATVERVAEGGADAVVTHRGNVRHTLDASPALGRIVHLNGASTLWPSPDDKRTVCTPATAAALGADAVSFHINVGSEFEGRQLAALAEAIDGAHDRGLPVLAMAYPRGPEASESDPADVAHAVRLAAEVGADVVKTAYPGDGFARAVAAVDVPVVIAGGAPGGDRDTLEAVDAAVAAGAAGVSIGRSIFQHDRPADMTTAIAAIVHEDRGVDAAMDRLEP